MVLDRQYMNFLSLLYPTILFVLNTHPNGGRIRIPPKLPSEDMNRGVPVDDCIPEVKPFDPQVANAAPQSS